jgi:DNA-binding response OmpR family regulator
MAKRILMVDDDRDLVEVTMAFLKAKGYEVDCAHDMEAGFARLAEKKPDLIILDMMMGGQGQGFLFSRKLRKMPEVGNIPILMVTGVTQQTGFGFIGDPKHQTFLPVDEFVQKPVGQDALAAKVASMLAKVA